MNEKYVKVFNRVIEYTEEKLIFCVRLFVCDVNRQSETSSYQCGTLKIWTFKMSRNFYTFF